MFGFIAALKLVWSRRTTGVGSKRIYEIASRSHLKKRVLAQVQGGPELQPAGILKYSEELKQGTNTEIGLKNFFEIASSIFCCSDKAASNSMVQRCYFRFHTGSRFSIKAVMPS